MIFLLLFGVLVLASPASFIPVMIPPVDLVLLGEEPAAEVTCTDDSFSMMKEVGVDDEKDV